MSALQLQKEYDRQKRDEEATRRRDAQLAKIANEEERATRRAQIEEGKRLKAEAAQLKKEETQRKKAEAELGKRVEKRTPSQLQIAGLTKRDVANTPKLETFFGGAGLNTRFQQRQGASSLTPGEGSEPQGVQPAPAEEPQQITFTQPTTRTFRPFEGGGL